MTEHQDHSRHSGHGAGGPRRGDRDSRSHRGGPRSGAPRNNRSYQGRAPQQSERRLNRRSEPRIPREITPEDLAFGARVELKSLTKENADLVARHLAMVALLEEDDPQLAHEHAMAAAAHAGRLGVVRETSGITAYRIGEYALALRELRTFHRITGSDEHAALIADCERGLGRSKQALEYGHSIDTSTLSKPDRVELAIVLSGAQRDLGDLPAARRELEIPELQKDRAFAYSSRLFEAYADVLEELHDPEAAAWSRRSQIAERAWQERNGVARPPAGQDTVVDLGALLSEEDSPEPSHSERGDRPRGGSDHDRRPGRGGQDRDRGGYRSDRSGSWRRDRGGARTGGGRSGARTGGPHEGARRPGHSDGDPRSEHSRGTSHEGYRRREERSGEDRRSGSRPTRRRWDSDRSDGSGRQGGTRRGGRDDRRGSGDGDHRGQRNAEHRSGHRSDHHSGFSNRGGTSNRSGSSSRGASSWHRDDRRNGQGPRRHESGPGSSHRHGNGRRPNQDH